MGRGRGAFSGTSEQTLTGVTNSHRNSHLHLRLSPHLSPSSRTRWDNRDGSDGGGIRGGSGMDDVPARLGGGGEGVSGWVALLRRGKGCKD